MKLLLFVIFLVIIKRSNAQQGNENAQDINGIGIFKLGKTEAQIISDLKIDSTDIIDGAMRTMKELVKKDSKSYVQIRFDPTSKLTKDILSTSADLDNRLEELGIEKCADAVLLVIPKYEIAGVTVEYLKLTFYKDTLIRISYKNTDDRNKNFLVAFKAKYGEGKSRRFTSEKSVISSTIISWESTVPDVVAFSGELLARNESDGIDIPFGGGTKSATTYYFRIQYRQYIRYLNDCNKKGATNKKNDEL